MARQTALPPNLPPRLITREAAAAYVNAAPSTFDKMVKDGVMPQPRCVNGRAIGFDVRDLDRAVDAMSPRGRNDNSWSDVDAA